jgi:hypothetical protein
MAALSDDFDTPEDPLDLWSSQESQNVLPLDSAASASSDQLVVEENPLLVENALIALENAIVEANDHDQTWTPSASLEVGMGSRLAFLRWAKFDTQKARARRALYWTERMSLWPNGGVISCAGDKRLQTALAMGIAEVGEGCRDNFGRQVGHVNCQLSAPLVN